MKAKPFVKWVGGKGQLIEQLEALLPADFDKWENVTYIEPLGKIPTDFAFILEIFRTFAA